LGLRITTELKDNESNWLPWELKTANIDLFKYYAGLIAIHKKYNAFNAYPINQIKWIDAKLADGSNAKSALGWIYDKAQSGDDRTFVILVNANKDSSVSFALPAGDWTVMVNGSTTTPAASTMNGVVTLAPFNGMILFQK
jgi:pullulanase/glycogen debranching enzyme